VSSASGNRASGNRGTFIVIEGIDGAGTTTQVARLAERLRGISQERAASGGLGRAVRTTREPSDGPVGTLVRQVLTGRIVVPGGRAPGWMTMALLFAADRMDHVESEIEPFVSSGGIMISDRYDASSLAYQSVSSGRGGEATIEWIRALNRFAARPDLTMVLDVPADIADARRRARGEAAQLYEQNEVQRALVAFYKDLARHLPNDHVVIVPAGGSVEEVHERLFEAYKKAFPVG
jgi:dTMP kinase